MASTTRLYTRSRPPRTHETENTSKMINVVIVDIDHNDLLINDPNIQMKVFSKDEINACVHYITSELTNLFLFISSDVGNTLIPFILNCPQINSIYILNKYEHCQNYPYANREIGRTFHDVSEMIKQFQNDIMLLTSKCYSEQSTFQSVNPESAQVLWWKFFDKMLQYIQHTDIAKEEFISFARKSFPDDERVLREIEEFEKTYESDNAIYWYTRNIFLFRFVNQILRRSKNLNNIFKLRLFLTDLMFGLKNAQLDFHSLGLDSLTLYRGKLMRKTHEIEWLKSAVDNSIVFNQLVSTTMNKEVAQIFAGDGYTDSSRESVIFTITIDSLNLNGETTAFADISKFSVFREESEVLFSMHSTFLVKSVQRIEDNLWNVHLIFQDNLWDTDFDQRSIFSPHADQIFVRHLSKENKQFIAFQLLLDIILRLDQTSYAKAELLEFCRSKYHDKPKQLEEIGNFDRDYQSENAAKWYTKDSFLHRLLNQSLRVETIDHIVKMRYYIHDLHNQLAELQKDFIQSLKEEKNLTLYRGQPMKKKELDDLKENKDGFISMNSFLSATQDEKVAFMFSGDGQTTEPDEVSVIYEMLIDTNIRSTPYAKIKSVNPDEQEILFSMGSIFRIGDVEKVIDHAGVFRVKLTMVHIEDQLWNKLTAHLD
jgi:hypothetical protein